MESEQRHWEVVAVGRVKGGGVREGEEGEGSPTREDPGTR